MVPQVACEKYYAQERSFVGRLNLTLLILNELHFDFPGNRIA